MSALPPISRLLGRQRIPRSTAGVGLVELMVVVLIISMLMALAVPSYQRVQKKAKAAAIVNDMRVFAAIYQAYAHENGAWPLTQDAGVVPVGITSQEMKTDVWTRPTPMGGNFKWEAGVIYNGVPVHAAIAVTDDVTPMLIDLDLLTLLDEGLDDGNLNTGTFILGDNNTPVYILEQ